MIRNNDVWFNYSFCIKPRLSAHCDMFNHNISVTYTITIGLNHRDNSTLIFMSLTIIYY